MRIVLDPNRRGADELFPAQHAELRGGTMNCNAYHALLRDYMAGEVSAAQRLELERHAAECRECSALHVIAHETSCREFTDFLDDYLELRLPEERHAVFVRHLSICADCRTYLTTYRRAIELVRRSHAGADAMPGPLVRDILEARKRS